MHLADRHNFGKRVEKIQRGSETWFQKPRTVFWEWLFFGRTSPLAEVFFQDTKYGPLSNFIFNLDVEVKGSWQGYAREMKEDATHGLSLSHYYGFGALLAYSYILGIRDLHRHNLVKTKSHFQVVDAEVVLTNLLLPSETLLLPFKNIGYELAGIGHLAQSAASFTQEQVGELLTGYFNLFQHALSRKDEIAHVLSSLPLSCHPVRVIVRNTSEYTKILEGIGKLDLMPSEVVQIERGDVPYFFKYVGDPGIKWLSSPDIEAGEAVLQRFVADIGRHADTPLPLLERNLFSSTVMMQGALQLIRHLRESCPRLSLKLDSRISVDFKTGSVEVGVTRYSIA